MKELQAENGTRKKSGGRPLSRERKPGKKIHLGILVTPEMKRRIEEISAVTGRSQSQEAELRIEQSFWLDDLLKARLISARVPAKGREG